MAPLPSETWLNIFSHLSVVDDVASSQPEAWTKIVTDNRVYGDRADKILSESNATKRALGLASRNFHELSKPLTLESITLRTVDQVHHLALTILEKPQLARAIGQWTKALYILSEAKSRSETGCDMSSMDGNQLCGEGPHQLLADLELIIRTCAKLRYFSCGILPSLLESPIHLARVLSSACPSLEVLRWHFILATGLMQSSVLSSFGELRVLDLTASLHSMNMDSYELPHLHTLIGAPEVIFPHFLLVQLPSFRTLICTRTIPRLVSVQDFVKFFDRHGERITSLDVRHESHYVQAFLTLCPNVVELIIDGCAETELFEMPWPKVRSIGISNKIGDAQVLLYTFGLLDSQAEKGNYPALKTVRILEKRTVQHLRERNTMATQLYERRLRSWSIRLEDDSGDLIVPESLKVFQKGVSVQVR